MKILDWYILRKFLGTFFYCIILINVIVIVFDVSEHLEDFIHYKAPVSRIIIEYYCMFVPYLTNLFSPLFLFISIIFFTSKLAANYEFVAMLNGGITYIRLLRPYMIGAGVIAVMSLFLNHYVIPKATRVRIDFEDKFLHDPYTSNERNYHFFVSNDTKIYMEWYDNMTNKGHRFSMEQLKGSQLIYKMNAEFIVYDSIKNTWQVNNFNERKIDSLGHEKLTFGTVKDTVFDFKPSDMGRMMFKQETMDAGELNAFIERQKLRDAGSIQPFVIEKYRRTAFPFASFVLTFIAVCLSSRKTRGGIGLHLGLGLLIAFSYIMVMQITTMLSLHANFNPLIAVWLPNILFTFLAFFFYRNAQK